MPVSVTVAPSAVSPGVSVVTDRTISVVSRRGTIGENDAYELWPSEYTAFTAYT